MLRSGLLQTLPGHLRRILSVRSGLLVLCSLGAVACSQAGGDEAQGAETADQAANPEATTDQAAAGQDMASPQDAAATDQAADQQDVFDLRDMGMDEGSVMTAVLAVADFSDFGCIHCANFHVDDYPAIYDEFIQGGDVLWKYIPITLGGFPNGDLAALTGICATDLGPVETFPEIRHTLFTRRDEWLTATPSEARKLFVSFASDLGIDTSAFEACIDSDSTKERLDHNNDTARKIGVTATPTFIVAGNPVVGAPPLSEFQRVLRQLIEQAQQIQQGGGDTPDSAQPDA